MHAVSRLMIGFLLRLLTTTSEDHMARLRCIYTETPTDVRNVQIKDATAPVRYIERDFAKLLNSPSTVDMQNKSPLSANTDRLISSRVGHCLGQQR